MCVCCFMPLCLSMSHLRIQRPRDDLTSVFCFSLFVRFCFVVFFSFLYVLFVSLFVYGFLLWTAHLRIHPARVQLTYLCLIVVLFFLFLKCFVCLCSSVFLLLLFTYVVCALFVRLFKDSVSDGWTHVCCCLLCAFHSCLFFAFNLFILCWLCHLSIFFYRSWCSTWHLRIQLAMFEFTCLFCVFFVVLLLCICLSFRFSYFYVCSMCFCIFLCVRPPIFGFSVRGLNSHVFGFYHSFFSIVLFVCLAVFSFRFKPRWLPSKWNSSGSIFFCSFHCFQFSFVFPLFLFFFMLTAHLKIQPARVEVTLFVCIFNCFFACCVWLSLLMCLFVSCFCFGYFL